MDNEVQINIQRGQSTDNGNTTATRHWEVIPFPRSSRCDEHFYLPRFSSDKRFDRDLTLAIAVHESYHVTEKVTMLEQVLSCETFNNVHCLIWGFSRSFIETPHAPTCHVVSSLGRKHQNISTSKGSKSQAYCSNEIRKLHINDHYTSKRTKRRQ